MSATTTKNSKRIRLDVPLCTIHEEGYPAVCRLAREEGIVGETQFAAFRVKGVEYHDDIYLGQYPVLVLSVKPLDSLNDLQPGWDWSLPS